MSIQTTIQLEIKMLNFADIFTDGCDVKFVQGASCNIRAALPDGSLVDLSDIYRGKLKPSDFHFEYTEKIVRTPSTNSARPRLSGCEPRSTA